MARDQRCRTRPRGYLDLCGAALAGLMAEGPLGAQADAFQEHITQAKGHYARYRDEAQPLAEREAALRRAMGEFEAAYLLWAAPGVALNLGEGYRLLGEAGKALRYCQEFLARKPQAQGDERVVAERCVREAGKKDGARRQKATPARNKGPSARDQARPGEEITGGMARVSGATISMGSEDGDADEKPVHYETVRTFFMDRTEVTVGAYEACVQAGGCKPAEATVDWPGISEEDRKEWSPQCNAGKTDRRDHPINCVTWAQAGAFCKWAGKRLPTEAEWEYAARGKEGLKYPWGSEDPGPALLNACGSECVKLAKEKGWGNWSHGWPTTTPVGSFPAGKSPFGLLDMAGNVWEWTASPYCARYGKNCASDSLRVARGGSWFNFEPALLRGTSRSGSMAVTRLSYLGFRCAKSAP